jgi:hypothetical protein
VRELFADKSIIKNVLQKPAIKWGKQQEEKLCILMDAEAVTHL